jgi:hypothetical protein
MKTMTKSGNGDLFALPAVILSPGCLKGLIFGAATIMTFPIMVTSSGWAVIAMLRDAWALKGSQMGYSWQIQLCRNCYTQLGWKYMSQDDSFYGLIFKMLREEKPEEDNVAAP